MPANTFKPPQMLSPKDAPKPHPLLSGFRAGSRPNLNPAPACTPTPALMDAVPYTKPPNKPIFICSAAQSKTISIPPAAAPTLPFAPAKKNPPKLRFNFPTRPFMILRSLVEGRFTHLAAHCCL